MRSLGFGRRRSRAVAAGAGAVALSLVWTSAGAAVMAGEDPAALAGAFAGTASITAASLQVDYGCVADYPTTTAVDETTCPTGVSNGPLAGFPTSGGTFGIITSGNAALADDPNNSPNSGVGWLQPATPIGPGVFDYQVVRIDLGAAAGNCLAFDFKFLSEEYPEFVNDGYNDAFIAQLNTWAVTADPTTQSLAAPGNFAAGVGDAISIDSVGPSAMSADHAVGTTYDGATLPLVARAPVVPGSTNTLYLTIFDQGDSILDSAVFVDNLRYETLAAGQSAGQCKSLAVDPFEGTLGVVVTPGTTGTFSPPLTTFTVPLTSTLPSGPVESNISATASFLNWGDVVPRQQARDARRATTPLGSGTARIPAAGSGNLVLTTTPAGIAAVKAARAQPTVSPAEAIKLKKKAKKLKKKAKKLTKKAKKLKRMAKAAPPAKAKQLRAQAKKLMKKAKRAKRQSARLIGRSNAVKGQPVGTVVVTMTNTGNGASERFRFHIPR